MEYIYSAMLLHSAGKKVDEAGITAVLKAAGVTADATRVKALTAALEGVDIEEAMKTSAGFAVAAAPAPAEGGAPPAGKPDAKKPEKKKEEKKEEVSEEEAAAGLGALFG
jgi:large subunit ribosomal protein L12